MNNIISITPINYQLFSTNAFTTLHPEAFFYSNKDKFISLITDHPFYEMMDNHGNKSYTK